MGGCKLGQGQNSSKNLANHVWRAKSQGQEVPVVVGDGKGGFKAYPDPSWLSGDFAPHSQLQKAPFKMLVTPITIQ